MGNKDMEGGGCSQQGRLSQKDAAKQALTRNFSLNYQETTMPGPQCGNQRKKRWADAKNEICTSERTTTTLCNRTLREPRFRLCVFAGGGAVFELMPYQCATEGHVQQRPGRTMHAYYPRT